MDTETWYFITGVIFYCIIFDWYVQFWHLLGSILFVNQNIDTDFYLFIFFAEKHVREAQDASVNSE